MIFFAIIFLLCVFDISSPYYVFICNLMKWVYEEDIAIGNNRTQKLSDIINTSHENIKYLPGIKLPPNVIAVPDLKKACYGATLLIFVLPHQFLSSLLPTIRDAVQPSCRGISLIKGLGNYIAR